MIREIYFFLRHGPATMKRKREMGAVEFKKYLAKKMDADGFAELRFNLVGDLEGDILEIGAGTGATFTYYGKKANVTAIEPDDEYRRAALEEVPNAKAGIKVISGTGENLPFDDSSFDAVSASTVLCSVMSLSKTLEEFKRVLRPGGKIRLLEHVCSEHWFAGPAMDLFNPIWRQINQSGCNCNRRTVEEVKKAGFLIQSLGKYKIYSKAVPAAFPLRLIKGER